MPFIIIIGIIILAIIIKGIRVVPQEKAIIVERLGAYKCTLTSGLHVINPILDRVRNTVDLREKVVDFPPGDVITKDNVTMKIDSVVYYKVLDPKLYTYGIENPIVAIGLLASTTLRNIIGDLELDQTLTSRDVINGKMCDVLDEATDPWGIKIQRVELKNIMPPKNIQDAMDRQMTSERERREKVIQAEAEKQSAILIAEGEKTAQVTRAEAEKEAAILKAEAEAESRIKLATAEAESIRRVKEAEAEGIKLLKNAGADKNVLTLKSYEAMVQVANGNATKIIVPSNLQNLVTDATIFKESFDNKKNNSNIKEDQS